jgi:hypothetical protein
MTMTETSTANDPAGRSGSREKDRATRQERPDQQVQPQAAELANAQRKAEELVLEQAVQRLREELGEARNGSGGQQLLLIARQRLMAQLHELDQERGREQLAAASHNSEEAAAGALQGAVILLRSALPAAATRPEEVIDTAFGLAEHGIQVMRRVALEVVSAARELVAA